MSKILITGGAGFIGSALVERLYKKHDITIYDNLLEQVHGINPEQHFDKANFIYGDVRNEDDFKKALQEKDIIIHLAAETGTAQSMLDIKHHLDVNTGGMAILCDYLCNSIHNVSKVVLGSSRAVYGEGTYYCNHCALIYPKKRDLSVSFDVKCPECGSSKVFPSMHKSIYNPTSIYGMTKQTQEQLLQLTINYSIILRLQNVYGEGESLVNDHKGILVFLAKKALQNEPIEIYEDGEMVRDFVYIDDVVDAFETVIDNEDTNYTLDIGTGVGLKIMKVAKMIVDYYKSQSSIIITGKYRDGDIKNSKIYTDFETKYPIEKGLPKFLDWVKENA